MPAQSLCLSRFMLVAASVLAVVACGCRPAASPDIPNATPGASETTLSATDAALETNPSEAVSTEAKLDNDASKPPSDDGDNESNAPQDSEPAGSDAADQASSPPQDEKKGPRRGRLFAGGVGDGVVDISFDDLNLGMQPDVVFRPFMLTDRAKELDGTRVRIKGFIMASDRTKGMKEFVLLRNTECKFGPGGQADHLLRVFMKEGETADYNTKPVSVEGVLRIKPFPDPRQTWSVYDLEIANSIKVQAR